MGEPRSPAPHPAWERCHARKCWRRRGQHQPTSSPHHGSTVAAPQPGVRSDSGSGSRKTHPAQTESRPDGSKAGLSLKKLAARAPGSGIVEAQRGGARLPPPGHCRPPPRALCNRWGQLDAAPCSHVPVATGLGADPGPVQWGLGGLRQGPSVGRAGSGCGTGDRGGTWWHPRSGGDSCWCN